MMVNWNQFDRGGSALRAAANVLKLLLAVAFALALLAPGALAATAENGAWANASVAGGTHLGADEIGPELASGSTLAAKGAGQVVREIGFQSAHGARHLTGTGLNATEVEAAIRQSVEASVRGASSIGSFWGRVTVRGKVIEYRAFTPEPGRINVGTYYPVGN